MSRVTSECDARAAQSRRRRPVDANAVHAPWHDDPMGPTTIFDKSALQSLSMDEAVWFDAFYTANVVPLFYVETLADLEKEVRKGKSAEDLVGMLAAKTPSHAFPNVHHRDLILGELAGNEFAMTGQVVIAGGATKKTADGSVGLHIDQFPEAAALHRWQAHDFLEIERGMAKDWRAELAAQDPTLMVDAIKNIVPPRAKFSDLEHLKAFIDSFCASDAPEAVVLALDVLGAPDGYRRAAFERWKLAGRPPLDRFLPYATHVFKVDLLFYLGIARGFISGRRASNKVDMAYLYYLPFAMAFTSGDRLHHRTAPLFLREDQSYLRADELKAALEELDGYYDALPEDVKARGVLAFASYPPSDLDNAVTRMWDKHMRPDWRKIAAAREADRGKQRDETADRETVADLTKRLEEAQPVSEAEVGADDHDYFVLQRFVPTTKGKWRMVSKEIEEAEDQN